MTKKQQEKFVRRMDTIHQRGIRRSHAVALDTMRQLQNLGREYRDALFKGTKPARSKV